MRWLWVVGLVGCTGAVHVEGTGGSGGATATETATATASSSKATGGISPACVFDSGCHEGDACAYPYGGAGACRPGLLCCHSQATTSSSASGGGCVPVAAICLNEGGGSVRAYECSAPPAGCAGPMVGQGFEYWCCAG